MFKCRLVLGPAWFFSLLTTPNIAVLYTDLCRIFWNHLTWTLFLIAILKSKHALSDTDHADWLSHVIWIPCSSPHLCCYFSQPILLIFFSLKKEISLDASVSMAAWNKWWSSSVILWVRYFVTWHGEYLKELVSLPSLQRSCFLFLTPNLLSECPSTCRVI